MLFDDLVIQNFRNGLIFEQENNYKRSNKVKVNNKQQNKVNC